MPYSGGIAGLRERWVRSGFRASAFRFRVSGFGFRVSGLRVWAGFGFRVSDSGFRASGFGCRVSGFGLRAFGFGFQVHGFRFRMYQGLFQVQELSYIGSGVIVHWSKSYCILAIAHLFRRRRDTLHALTFPPLTAFGAGVSGFGGGFGVSGYEDCSC